MSDFYNDGMEQLLSRTISADAGLYAVGVNNLYVFDAEHKLFTDIDDHIILPETPLVNATFFNGYLDAADTLWSAAGTGLPEGTSLELTGVIIYFKLDDTGTLFAFIDRASVGLPQTLAGVNVTAKWRPEGILRI